jgi:hypothetical protein
MKVITRYEYAQSAPQRWIDVYKNRQFSSKWDYVTEKMEQMTLPVNPDEIDALIGNTSWTNLSDCSECGSRSDPIIEVGQEPDYASRTAYLCIPCLERLVTLVKERIV